MIRSIKAYGEYFVKPGMTEEAWRADWVACGGRSNGDYSNGASSGSNDATLTAANEKKAKELATCMQSKGYEYHYTGP